MASEKKEPNLFRHILKAGLLGSFYGGTEVLVNHPLWSLKTLKQSGRNLTLNPRILYIGLPANAASMIPGTAIQVSIFESVKHQFFKQRAMDSKEGFSLAFLAGAVSALVTGPTELLMTRQSLLNASFLRASTVLYRDWGLKGFYPGFTGQAIRDGFYAAFFLAATPKIQTTIKPWISDNKQNMLASGICSGLLAFFFSQPADTIKTLQQSGLSNGGFARTAMDIYRQNGCPGFFTGGSWRALRVTSGVTLISSLKNRFDS